MPSVVSFSRCDQPWMFSDMGAGLSVAAIVLPVGIASADLAGVPTVVGMCSAIFILLAYTLFGSSRQLMTDPDAATWIIAAASSGLLAGGNPERYLALMVLLRLMTGFMFSFVFARVKQILVKYFKEGLGLRRKETHTLYRYDTLKSAVRGFNNRGIQAVN